MRFLQKKLNTDLNIFLGTIATLTIIGILFIYSSSSVFALERFGSPTFFAQKQVYALGLGFVALIAARLIPLHIVKQFTPLLFFVSLILTVFTLIPGIGRTINGSSRWISFFGFAFQPSELLKIGLLLYTAHFLT